MSKYVVPGLPRPSPKPPSPRAFYLSPAAARQHEDIKAIIRPALQRRERVYHQAALSRWVKTAIRRMKEQGCHVIDVVPGYILAAALDDVVSGHRSSLLTPSRPKQGRPASNEEWMLWLHIVLVLEVIVRAAGEITLREAATAALAAIDAEVKRYGGKDQSVLSLLPGSGREAPNAIGRKRKGEQSQQQVAHERFVTRCLERRDSLISCEGLPGGDVGQIALSFREALEGLKCPDGVEPAVHFANERDYVAGVTAHLLLARRRHCG